MDINFLLIIVGFHSSLSIHSLLFYEVGWLPTPPGGEGPIQPLEQRLQLARTT